jgi:hypothetical protein
MALMKTIIVTASDEKYSSLLLGSISSLHQWEPGLCDAIGVLDLGLSDSTLQKIRGKVTHIVIPGWDLAIDPTLRSTAPYLRAFVARPFLPKYFPGYDIYLWLDADTWLQERFVVEWFIQAAMNGALGIVPEVHQSYDIRKTAAIQWRKERLHRSFGDRAVELSETCFSYNSGAFSLQGASPHWNTWARYLANGLRTSPQIVDDQTPINYAIWNGDIAIHPLPALCNWCCHFAIPGINVGTKKFCEPHIPNQAIGLIHMSAATHNLMINFDRDGKTSQTSLRFGDLSSLE